MVIGNKNIAFGSSSKRFNNQGLHPKLGITNEYSNIAPGVHQKLEEWNKKKIPGVKWVKSEVKDEIKTKLQFSYYRIPTSDKTTDTAHPKISPIIENDVVQKQQKTPSVSKYQPKESFSTPGSGFYGKGHIPSQRLEDWSKGRKFAGSFHTTKSSRYPEYMVAPSWKMTPAQYAVKDPGSIQGLLERRISKKGPYQLFTGERDETTLTGFFAMPKFKGSAKMFYELPSEMNHLNNPSKRYVGRWSPLSDQQNQKSRCDAKATQRHLIGNVSFVYRDPLEPGPAHYYPKDLNKIKYAWYGFNPPFLSRDKSNKGLAHFIKNTPGVARYYPMDVAYVNGHQSVFKSREPRMKSQVMR